MSEKSRRDIIKALGIGGATLGLGTLTAQNAQAIVGFTPARLHIVGDPNDGGQYATIQAAVAAARLAQGGVANRDSAQLVYVLPGRYVLTAPLVMAPFIDITGASKNSVHIIAWNTNTVRAASNATLSNLTIHYDVGSNEAVTSTTGLSEFGIYNVNINVKGSAYGLRFNAWIARAELRDLTIVTERGGVSVGAGGNLYMHDCNIHLVQGETSSPHIGVIASSYVRIYIFGGKIGTGYGVAAIRAPSLGIVGVQLSSNASGRVELFNVWSICSNFWDTPEYVKCVRILGPEGWVRVHGGYYQAESSNFTQAKAFDNPGLGRLEVYGARAFQYGEGPVYSSNQIGLATYTVANHNQELKPNSGGLIKLDAAAGSFRLRMPYYTPPTEQYIFKKVDATANTITLDLRGQRIDGQSGNHVLATPYQSLHIRWGGDQWYIV